MESCPPKLLWKIPSRYVIVETIQMTRNNSISHKFADTNVRKEQEIVYNNLD